MEYDFTLKFKLPTAEADVDSLVERLGGAGCDDAVVGIGQPGRVALDFTREANSASDAVFSAIEDVKRAIPGAKLIEAGPDYVGLTDVGEFVGVSRQNMRKLMAAHFDFPNPVHTAPSQIWHLESVLQWLVGRQQYQVEQRLLDIARIAMQCNLTKEAGNLEPTVQRKIHALVA
jgi:hypothetical protein